MNRNFVATASKENGQMDLNGMERSRRHNDKAIKTKEDDIFHQIMPKKARSSYEATSLSTISPYKYKVSQNLSSVIKLSYEFLKNIISNSLSHEMIMKRKRHDSKMILLRIKRGKLKVRPKIP